LRSPADLKRRRAGADAGSVSLPSPAPRVSVVIAAYNYARYLPRAIDSVFAQDYPADRVELIVVDDGSTDETPDVLARYGDRVRAVRQPNQGQPAATEHGLRLATGDLLTLLDADDLWPRGRLTALVSALAARPDAGLVYGDMAVVDERGRPLHASFRQAMRIHAHEGRILGPLLACNCVSGGALMVRARHKAQILPFPADVAHQDWWIAYAVARVSPIAAIADVVSLYRMHGDNENLGADTGRQVNLFRTELPFRRRLILEAELGDDVTPAHVLDALIVFDQMARAVVGGGHALPVPADRDAALAQMGAASEALDDGDVDAARMRLFRAAALDPSFDAPRDLIIEIEQALAAPVAA
jgi:glycosyltransferase involved in cell wall biosynthesis